MAVQPCSSSPCGASLSRVARLPWARAARLQPRPPLLSLTSVFNKFGNLLFAQSQPQSATQPVARTPGDTSPALSLLKCEGRATRKSQTRDNAAVVRASRLSGGAMLWWSPTSVTPLGCALTKAKIYLTHQTRYASLGT